jgi:hypothetical protein
MPDRVELRGCVGRQLEESAVSMWLMPRSTAARSTAIAASRSFGGPKTPGPASCIAP